MWTWCRRSTTGAESNAAATGHKGAGEVRHTCKLPLHHQTVQLGGQYSDGSTQYCDDIVRTNSELKHKVPLSVGNHLIAELIAVTLDVAGEIGIHWYCTV